MRFLLSLCLLALLPLLLPAQEPKKPEVAPIKVVALDRKEPVVYEKDVEPILVKKCFFCHSGNVKESKFDMGSFEALMKGGRRGKAVTPGKAETSLLYLTAGRMERPTMPPKNEEPLTPEELALVKLWIDQGAKAPTGARVKPKVVLTPLPPNVQPVRALAVSPDKSALAAGRGNQIHVYDAGSGTFVRSLIDPNLATEDKKPVQGAHLAVVESLAFSPDGKFLASGSFQEVNIWDVQTGTLKQKLTGFADRVVTLHFAPGGKMLATGGGAPTEDGEVKIFEMPEGKLLLDLKNSHSDTVFGVCFSADAKMLATCGADKFVKTWEIPSGKLLKAFEGHTHHVLDVGWKPDGKLLASCGADNVIKIWNFETGEQKQTIANAHTKQATRLVFVGTQPSFWTASGDNTAKLWNVDNGGNQRTITDAKDFLYGVAVTPDGQVVATGGEEGIVRLYLPGKPVMNLLPPGAAEEPKK